VQDTSPPGAFALRSAAGPLLRARSLFGATLSKAFSARLSLWLHAGIAAYYALQTWGAGHNAVGPALGALALPALLTTLSFFRRGPSDDALVQLARLRGMSVPTLNIGLFFARAWLAMRPFLISVPLLWLSAMGAQSALSAWALLPLGILAGWACAVGLGLGLSGLAWLSEQLSPARPGRLLTLLVIVPALLKPAVPELPSLWHGYQAWAHWAASHVGPL
jgi:hypothetical protein